MSETSVPPATIVGCPGNDCGTPPLRDPQASVSGTRGSKAPEAGPRATCDAEVPLSEQGTKEKKEKKDKKGGDRREKSAFEKALLGIAWLVLAGSFVAVWLYRGASPETVPGFLRFCAAGTKDLLDFLGQHLVSAMIPAFFVAAAISTFFSKETVIRTLGRNTSPFISYPLAAFAGAILTVCSCGVLPIFMSILQSGAGLGPASTFLYASPAINLISVVYTWKILPNMLWPRILAVAISAIGIGILMGRLFPSDESASAGESQTQGGKTRTALQEWAFFFLLVLVMLTSTEALAPLTGGLVPPSWFASSGPEMAGKTAALAGKLFALVCEIVLVILVLRAWFTWDETRKWLKRTWRQASEILPMVVLGVFFSGMLGGLDFMVDSRSLFKDNSILANLLASLTGALLYFGSIVGVNTVKVFLIWKVHPGPAFALLLAGPAVSLPSALALMPIIGKWKALAYLVLVALFSAVCGLLFGLYFL